MMPLLDVVFLLLTFFIYAMVVLVEVKASGVELLSIEGGAEAVEQQIVLIEVDGGGGVLIDGRAVADDELDSRLVEVASRVEVPPVVVALQEVEATVDRGPVIFRLEDRIRRAGITDIRRLKLESGSSVEGR